MTTQNTSRLLQNRLTSARQAFKRLADRLAQVPDAAADINSISETIAMLIEQQPQQRANNRLARLFQVSRLIGSSLDPQTVLEQTMDALIELTGAERGFVVLLEQSGQLELKIGRNLEHRSVDDLTISRTIVRRVIENGESVLTTNAQEDERFAGLNSVIGHNLVNIMVCPLIIEGNPIGALYVDNNSQRGMFFPEDLDLLGLFAEQVAMAIHNALEVERRERALQHQIAVLRIEIDEIRKAQQVSEITDNEGFRNLADQARILRERRHRGSEPED